MDIQQEIDNRYKQINQLNYELRYLEALQAAKNATATTDVPGLVDFIKRAWAIGLKPPKLESVDSCNVIIAFDTIPVVRLGVTAHCVYIMNGYNAGGDTLAGLSYIWDHPGWTCMYQRLGEKVYQFDGKFDLSSFISKN